MALVFLLNNQIGYVTALFQSVYCEAIWQYFISFSFLQEKDNISDDKWRCDNVCWRHLYWHTSPTIYSVKKCEEKIFFSGYFYSPST